MLTNKYNEDNSMIESDKNCKKIKYFNHILASNSQEIAIYLVYPHNKFFTLLNDSSEHDLNIASLLLDIISKACNSTYTACNKYISALVQSSSFWLNTIPILLSNITSKDSSFLNSLFNTADVIYKTTLNDLVITHIENIINVVPGELQDDVNSKFLKLRESKINLWEEFDSDNYRYTECVFPSDLDSYCSMIQKNSLFGGYDDLNNYLDTHFYIIKEAIISHFKTLINLYWNRIENNLIHTGVFICDKFFLDDGVHLILSFPLMKDRIEKFQPGMELCLALDEFNRLNFATVLHCNTNNNNFSKYCLVKVKLITNDIDILVKGKTCIVLESFSESNSYSKILFVLKNQSDIALQDYIVKVEKSNKPPDYINKSKILDFAPLSNNWQNECWFRNIDQIRNESSLKLEIFNQIWPASKFCISENEINIIREIFQRELALIKANNDLSKKLCLNLLKILDFNKSIWQKGNNYPLLVICNSDKMLEYLSMEIVNISSSPIMLHDKHKLEKWDVKELTDLVNTYGKRISVILHQIEIGNKYPLTLLECEEMSNLHGGYILCIENKILEWLCLTSETCIAYDKDIEEFYYRKFKDENPYDKSKERDYFIYIANNMFNISNEMNSREAESIENIWNLNLNNRWRLARYWKSCIIEDLNKNLCLIKQKYYQILDVLDNFYFRSDYNVLKNASVVFSTAKTALDYVEVLNSLKSNIVIVLEANEIAESYLIPFLNKSVEHLILIGSTKQLSLINKESDINVSMYDRLLANNLPYCKINEICNINIKKRLQCDHINHFTDDDNFKCKELISYTCRCGNQICIPCFQQNTYECKEIITIHLSCDHSVTLKCVERDDFDMRCNKWRKISLPCNHDIEIRCSELPIKCKEYFINGCHNKCKTLLDCNHECIGKCSNCIALSIHEGCMEKCHIRLNCGHYCRSKCGTPCSPCSSSCEWKCPHEVCNELCGDLCKKCTNLCTWSCPHYTCNKKCWEKCDRPICDKNCPFLLKCGHSCCGICGETCPSICSVCNPDEYEDLKLPECTQIIELNCGHMFNRITIISALDTIQSSLRPLCPLCNTPIENKGYVGTYVRAWHELFSERKANILNVINSGIKSILYHPKIVNLQNHQTIRIILETINKTKNLSTLILAKTHILYIIHLIELEETIIKFNKLKPEHKKLLNKCIKLKRWLGKHWSNTAFFQIEAISWEIHRMRQLCLLYKKQKKIKKFVSNEISGIFLTCEKAIKLLQTSSPYNNKCEEILKQYLTKMIELDKSIGNIFLKRVQPIQEQQFHHWLKGNVTNHQIIWKIDD